MKWLLVLLSGLTLVLAGAAQAQTSASDITNLQVVSVTELELPAGPATSGAHLAPNGERFAHLDIGGSALCIYTTAGVQERCASFEDFPGQVDSETIEWSPDSSYPVFTTDFLRYLTPDPDIWVMDAATGELINLTGEGVEDFSLFGENSPNIRLDLAPRWLADGTGVGFIRYRQNAGKQFNTPQALSVTLAGDETPFVPLISVQLCAGFFSGRTLFAGIHPAALLA